MKTHDVFSWLYEDIEEQILEELAKRNTKSTDTIPQKISWDDLLKGVPAQ